MTTGPVIESRGSYSNLVSDISWNIVLVTSGLHPMTPSQNHISAYQHHGQGTPMVEKSGTLGPRTTSK
jgi:hypothetical protein